MSILHKIQNIHADGMSIIFSFDVKIHFLAEDTEG